MGGKFHLNLNIDERPIVNKYREGKMKRTLKRELNVPEIVKWEVIEPSRGLCYILCGSGQLLVRRSYGRLLSMSLGRQLL